MHIHIDELPEIKYSTWVSRMKAYRASLDANIEVLPEQIELLKADCKNLLALVKYNKLKACIDENVTCDEVVKTLQSDAELLDEISPGFYSEVEPTISAYYKKRNAKTKISKLSKTELAKQKIAQQVVQEAEKTEFREASNKQNVTKQNEM